VDRAVDGMLKDVCVDLDEDFRAVEDGGAGATDAAFVDDDEAFREAPADDPPVQVLPFGQQRPG
jgi:hypothetical protein